MIENIKRQTNAERNEYQIILTDIFKNIGVFKCWNVGMLERWSVIT